MISDLNKQQVCSHEIETKDRNAYTILWFRGEENLYSCFLSYDAVLQCGWRVMKFRKNKLPLSSFIT